MDKQIAEMARIIAFDLCPNRYVHAKWGEEAQCYSDNNFAECAKIKNVVDKLYNAGYRKIPEGAVVLTREEAETIYGTLKANEEFIFDLQEATMVCKKEMEEAQKVAVKEIEEYVQQVRKETAEKYHAEMVKAIESVPNATKEFVEAWKAKNDEIAKEITEGENG